MRKELLVFISTTEKGEEISVVSVAKNRDFILFGTSNGKFTANRQELLQALRAIEEFDQANNTISGNVEAISPTLEIEYGEQ